MNKDLSNNTSAPFYTTQPFGKTRDHPPPPPLTELCCLAFLCPVLLLHLSVRLATPAITETAVGRPITVQ